MVNMLPVSRLQMPHLVAAKASPDESAGFVAIELESLPTTWSEAQSDWLDLAASFPNLRTRFLRSGRQMYQQVVEVGDCSERVFVSDGGEFRFEDDSFDVPCFYVWDPVTNSASLRVHHALVDSFSVAVIRSRGARFDVSQYEEFLRRTHSASVAEYATKIDPCMVPVEDEGFRDSYRVSRAHLPNQGSDALALDGELNFWYA